jgi:hypothetical protein
MATYQWFNPSRDELSSICHLLALLGAHHILHVSRIRVKLQKVARNRFKQIFKQNDENTHLRNKLPYFHISV